MKSFRARGSDFERELRAARPEPRDAFVNAVADDIRATRRRRSARRRIGLASAMAVVMISGFGAFGGFGYAASAASQAAKAVAGKGAVSPAQSQYGKKCGQATPGTPPGNPGNNDCPPSSGPKK
jgi:dihydroxyacetone kinase